MATRILIADDDASIRRLVRRILEEHPDWEVCGEAIDGQMGGRSGDEGPETVVLRDTCRDTEAARWRVNLQTGHRVLPM